MKKQLTIVATALLTVSPFNCFAAKPTAITYENTGTTPDGKEYLNYIVKCSNGEQQPLTAWDKRKKWCVGADSSDNCYRKQIKAAKKACKL